MTGRLVRPLASSPPGLELLAPLLDANGPLAIVSLSVSGLPESRSSEILEIGVLLLDGAEQGLATLHSLIQPKRPVPALISRLTGLTSQALIAAPPIEALADELRQALSGRTLVAHDAEQLRHFLARCVSPELARAPLLDTRDLQALTHPELPDLQLSSFGGALLTEASRDSQGAGQEEERAPASSAASPWWPASEQASAPDLRALRDAEDILRILIRVAHGTEAGMARYQGARSALERFLPGSLWLPLLGKGPPEALRDDGPSHFVRIEASGEVPVPFDEEAMASALADTERGRRYFKGYRSRPEQIELARRFSRNLRDGGTLLLEGGTGVGKSLAYLAAVIPFAMERAARGEQQPIVISTRTKLLQDQLLGKDIAAAARFLGHPDLRALSIKGRANYVCERRLADTLAVGSDSSLLSEDRLSWAVLLACARTRPGGEVGALPAELLLRHTLLRDLVKRSVARRAEQCSREDCARRPTCPFGQRRRALARAHLVVANHDLLLRWPPDYPSFGHVVVDEGHEIAGVADEVYALVVRPEDLLERIDEIFGGESARTRGAEPGPGLLPSRQRLEAARTIKEARRALSLDLTSIGRLMAEQASDYSEVQLPRSAERAYPHVAKLADAAASRLEAVGRLALELDARAEWTFDEAPSGSSEGPTPVQQSVDALREGATGLRSAFSESSDDVVAAFEGLVSPYDRWILAIRAVSPAGDFHHRFMQDLESFAAVSASLFIGGDSFAALGELEIEERSLYGVDRISLASPFDYEGHMRVVALDSSPTDLVSGTAAILAELARALGGRTLGLFTSLRRMNQVALRLADEFADEDIEILAPRRAADDPAGLVRRFRELPGGGVLLGARTFWQGLDIAGDDLQAVVIEKLPFEVPTELRKRRETRIRELGMDAFERFTLGKMLLYLKQMTGRLIRSEDDRGIVVIVDARPDRSYFGQLDDAFPPGSGVRVIAREQLRDVLAELGIGKR